MTNKKIQLILGSASPRRKDLLAYTYCPFKILVSDIEESSSEPTISDWVMDIAAKKAIDIASKAEKLYANPLILSADTIVVLRGEQLGKPKDRADAKRMLKLLSGSEHQVLTGVCLKSSEREKRFYSETTVLFEKISSELMELYLDTGEAFDKAGSYGIQAFGLAFVKEVHGSYSNVVGLPVNQVLAELESFVKEDYSGGNWRDVFER